MNLVWLGKKSENENESKIRLLSEFFTDHFGTETGVSSLFFLIKSILGFPSNSEPLHISGGEFIGTGAGDVSLEILDYSEILVFFCSEPFPCNNLGSLLGLSVLSVGPSMNAY